MRKTRKMVVMHECSTPRGEYGKEIDISRAEHKAEDNLLVKMSKTSDLDGFHSIVTFTVSACAYHPRW